MAASVHLGAQVRFDLLVPHGDGEQRHDLLLADGRHTRLVLQSGHEAGHTVDRVILPAQIVLVILLMSVLRRGVV